MWTTIGVLAGGFLLGSYGLKILGSKDAKKVYTHTTAAVLRMKDEVMKDITTIRENAEDIAAAARDINEKLQQAEDEKVIEDAKAVLARAAAQGEEGCAGVKAAAQGEEDCAGAKAAAEGEGRHAGTEAAQA